ncbi:MAG: hypothetical protein ACI97N_002009 [Cognaticolwellia sp.]|jgi:hypothetical protein
MDKKSQILLKNQKKLFRIKNPSQNISERDFFYIKKNLCQSIIPRFRDGLIYS